MAALSTNVIPIDVGREPLTRVLSSNTTLELRKAASIETGTMVTDLPLLRKHEVEHSQPGRLSQDELYPARQAFSQEHITALRLLKLAVRRCQRAINAQGEDDPVSADIEIQKVQLSLPELFCCRALGDGFGTVINALICAFENNDGGMLDRDHIRVMEQVFKELRDKPFLRPTEADSAVELLESNGFNPYPEELSEFLSSDQSIR